MILKDIWLDVTAVKERDPAARSKLEVLLLYQGVHALIWHRFAHWFYQHKMFFIARFVSQLARFFTLIEIHPGAQLGHGILIDHGSGVVIGETTVVGDNCTIAANAVLLKPLESNVTAVGIPARPIKIDGVPLPKKESNLVTMDHYCKMEERVKELEETLSKLQTELSSYREKEHSDQAEASLEGKIEE